MAKVKIYSTPSCPFCVMAKEWFEKNNIEFENIDVSADNKAGEEMVEKSGQMGVPVIIVTMDDDKEEVIVGFEKDKLSELLNVNE